ncbi:hypothetical protein CEXT_329911 [Caerostris extrusa]|uniref:Uncharacterized protein n=1 Tax=Caerostris extrusa TaxID=172846 RepID=A0AAV4XDA7_CAEEX|nr:hypothetical protein CEXT_329911 [Caerostris extrusa]
MLALTTIQLNKKSTLCPIILQISLGKIVLRCIFITEAATNYVGPHYNTTQQEIYTVSSNTSNKLAKDCSKMYSIFITEASTNHVGPHYTIALHEIHTVSYNTSNKLGKDCSKMYSIFITEASTNYVGPYYSITLQKSTLCPLIL